MDFTQIFTRFPALYDLGNSYDIKCPVDTECIEFISRVDDSHSKSISIHLYEFLIDNDFVDGTNGELSECAKQFYYHVHILEDTEYGITLLRERLMLNPITNLIAQVFYGRGKISKVQLCNLLNFHRVSSMKIEESDVSSLLILLNKYSILTYDKKNSLFYVNEPTTNTHPIKQYFVEPSTPFSNLYNIRKAFRTCQGKIYWIDKHFRKEGLEIVLDGLANTGVLSVTIISGKDNITQSAISDYHLLQQELQNRSIDLSWKLIDNSAFKWHDRWLISDSYCYNIPPVLALLRGQRAEILETDVQLDVMGFLKVSQPVR